MNSAYAVVVPLNQFACASTTTGQFMVLVDVGAGAVTDMGVTRICEATGADEMTTFVMGLGAGMVTGMAVDSLNPTRPQQLRSMEMDSGKLHTTISELQRRGYLGDGNSLPSSFADMMSPEDAGRYTYYLENGSSLPSAYAEMMSSEDAAKYTHFLEYGGNSGLTPSELAGIQRLDECLALGRVNYDEVLALRRQSGAGEELLCDNVTTNAYKEISGMEWYEYFRETYGKENVCWESCNPSEVASAWQGSYPYLGVDDYTNITLRKGDIIWMGEPYPTGYSTTLTTINGLGNDAQKIFGGLQVKPYYEMGMPYAEYRAKLTPYQVNADINVAEGIALNNPQFGKGGLVQRFDPNFDFNVANNNLTRLDTMAIDLSNTRISLEDYFEMMNSIN